MFSRLKFTIQVILYGILALSALKVCVDKLSLILANSTSPIAYLFPFYSFVSAHQGAEMLFPVHSCMLFCSLEKTKWPPTFLTEIKYNGMNGETYIFIY